VRGKLEDVNHHLEQQVEQRTADLQRRTEELRSLNKRLESELIERERAEQARGALKEELIQMQSALLEELSIPLIPITEQVMVLPLIGSVDDQRAARMLDTVTHGAQRHAARMVIIDITGMKQVDTYAANALVRMASALRLLGAEAVLNPEDNSSVRVWGTRAGRRCQRERTA
jgi:anti-anti-sigma regulatory factor